MSLVIPDEIIQTIHMTPAELIQEIAILLYQKEKLTLGQASHLAGLVTVWRKSSLLRLEAR
jgi:predicted HTH domain antitoxin